MRDDIVPPDATPENKLQAALTREIRMRYCMQGWNALARAMGYDGVEPALLSLRAMQRGPRSTLESVTLPPPALDQIVTAALRYSGDDYSVSVHFVGKADADAFYDWILKEGERADPPTKTEHPVAKSLRDRLARRPTSCGECSYEEANGELIEQCAKCKAADALAPSSPPLGYEGASAIEHRQRMIGHASGWQEPMNTCVCGQPWPCPSAEPPTDIADVTIDSMLQALDAMNGLADQMVNPAQDFDATRREIVRNALGLKGKTPCICQGNWRHIVKDNEAKIGTEYVRNNSNEIYRFFGIVHGDDDYYYGLSSRVHGTVLLSCVGSIEGHGYSPLPTLKGYECKCGARILYGRKHLNCPAESSGVDASEMKYECAFCKVKFATAHIRNQHQQTCRDYRPADLSEPIRVINPERLALLELVRLKKIKQRWEETPGSWTPSDPEAVQYDLNLSAYRDDYVRNVDAAWAAAEAALCCVGEQHD